MNTPPSRTARATDALLVLIVLAVGTMAGAASFTHVHDWTLDHSPAGTASWLGWANAVITELVPTASLITIARRRRAQAPIGYPMFLLVVAVGFSLTAQLAVAEPSPFGWMVSALPSLAFFALSKLVFHTTRHSPDASVVVEPAQLVDEDEPPTRPSVPVEDRPVGDLVPVDLVQEPARPARVNGYAIGSGVVR